MLEIAYDIQVAEHRNLAGYNQSFGLTVHHGTNGFARFNDSVSVAVNDDATPILQLWLSTLPHVPQNLSPG